MREYNSFYFKVGVTKTKTLFKIKNLQNNNEIKIKINDLKKAYLFENIHIDIKLTLSRTLFLLDKDLSDLDEKISKNKNRLEAFKSLQKNANELENEFFQNYSYRCLFKELFNI